MKFTVGAILALSAQAAAFTLQAPAQRTTALPSYLGDNSGDVKASASAGMGAPVPGSPMAAAPTAAAPAAGSKVCPQDLFQHTIGIFSSTLLFS